MHTLNHKLKRWKVVHCKPREECNLCELDRKIDFSTRMMWSYTFTLILLLGVITELFIKDKVSIMFNTLFLACVIMLYDECQNRNNLKMFKYLKEREGLW